MRRKTIRQTTSRQTTSPPARSRRRWWQYGLRSLLLFILVAALVAKYLSRPEVLEEAEPHGAHRVVRQVIRDRDGNPVNHGTWIMFDPAGDRLVEGAYRNGQPHGSWTYWHESRDAWPTPRRRSMEGRYQRGKREGTWTTWYPTGQKRWEMVYSAGEPIGIARHWDVAE